jgi:two-component system CAI-1 autoinducer sensor kinase/phosphatase CqsS
LEPLLQVAHHRLFGVAVLLTSGHVIFGFLWHYILPQAYENIPARIAASLLSTPLFFLTSQDIREQPLWRWYCVVVAFLSCPAYLTWMYLMNPASAMWMSTASMSIVVIYLIIDWRLATIGLLIMTTLIGTTYGLAAPQSINPPETEGWIVLLFAWICGLVAGLSTANEHTHRLRSTLNALGVMAHELRTPLASASLLSSSLRSGSDPARTSILLDAVIRSMNHQIDSQIVNAQLLNLAPGTDHIGAMALVQNAIDTYPFKRDRDRANVITDCQSDFVFIGNTRLFTQVIQNLIRNSMQAISTKKDLSHKPSIRITIKNTRPSGLIQIQDNGPGIKSKTPIFEPFFSTQTNYSSGLGLAFCKQIVEIHRGQIWVESTSPQGTSFAIKMPCAHPTRNTPLTKPAPL